MTADGPRRPTTSTRATRRAADAGEPRRRAAPQAAHRPRQDRPRAEAADRPRPRCGARTRACFCGPKAAFLGELKHTFPDHVARGIVVPFGAYYDHYSARDGASSPTALRGQSIATPGEPLPAFVERTYKTFFDELIPAKTSEQELSAWIEPRLEVIRNSIRPDAAHPALREAIRDGLDARTAS